MTADVEVATQVAAPRTTSTFILMQRFGNDLWMAGRTGPTVEHVASTAKLGDGITAWRIVRVDNLPVSIPEGES